MYACTSMYNSCCVYFQDTQFFPVLCVSAPSPPSPVFCEPDLSDTSSVVFKTRCLVQASVQSRAYHLLPGPLQLSLSVPPTHAPETVICSIFSFSSHYLTATLHGFLKNNSGLITSLLLKNPSIMPYCQRIKSELTAFEAFQDLPLTTPTSHCPPFLTFQL